MVKQGRAYGNLHAERRNTLLLLALIAAAGATLRVCELGRESIWLDEATSIARAQTSLPTMVSVLASEDVHPPLYFTLLHLWIRVFGTSESSVRLISVIAGVLAVPVIFELASRLFDAETGLFSALLLAVSRFHVELSQEARSNAVLMLLTLSLIYTLVRALRTRDTRYFIANAAVSILLVYTHYFGLLIVVVQNLYFSLGWSRYKQVLSQWILSQGAVAVAYSPWLWAALSQVMARKQGVGAHAMAPTMATLIAIVREFNGITVSSWPFLEALVVLLVVLGMFMVTQRRGRFEWRAPLRSAESYTYLVSLEKLEHVLLLTLWLLVPILFTFALSRLIPVLETRSFIVVLPAMLILAGKGIRNIRPRSVQALVVVVLLLARTNDFRGYFGVVNKEQWREVASYVDANARAGDLILFNAPFTQEPFDYYAQTPDHILLRQPFLPGNPNTDESVVEKLRPLVAGHRRFWLILSHSRDPDELTKRTLSESYSQVDEQQYLGINLSLFEVDDGQR